MNSKKRNIVIICSILTILVFMLGAAYVTFHNLYVKTQYIPRTQAEDVEVHAPAVTGVPVQEETNATIEPLPEVPLAEEEVIPAMDPDADSMNAPVLTEEEEKTIAEEAEKARQDVSFPNDKNVYNILLIGSDRRTNTWNGNSDTMILLSVNKGKKEIHLISFMRDLYANIEGHGARKLNAAYAIGGADMLLSTIEINYGVHTDNYLAIDFEAMIDIVDKLGGLTLTMRQEEAEKANSKIWEYCRDHGMDDAEHLLTVQEGTADYGCDGLQVLSYSRIRYVGNADYERTQRQRTVILKLIEKIKTMTIPEITGIITDILPEISHDLPESEVLALVVQAPALAKYPIIQGRVPYDDLYTVKNEMLIPNFVETREKLKSELY